VPIFPGVQLLMAEAWRNERLINHFRTALFGTAVVFGGIATYFLLGRPHAAIPMIGGWTIFIAVFNATWFKRNFHPAVPWLLSAGEIALIGAAFLLARPVILANRPELADRQLSMLPPIFVGLVCINMLRFSWRLSLFSAGFAIAVLLGVFAAVGILDTLAVPLCMVLVAMGLVLAYTTRRFERLLQRQAVDMRRIQRERIASLRSLVAGVCHELNNPLGALRSNAQVSARSIELLSDLNKRERALNALVKVAAGTEEATARIEKTIDSLKRFARLDEAEVKITAVDRMIDDAIALLASELESIEVEKKYAELAPMTCRPGELNQVFMHVLRNAAQAGARKITIETRRSEESVEVNITDDGRGMSPETLSRIFDPTFSSEGGRVKMGFGLSASLGIIEDHGGRIEIESQIGRGTIVKLSFKPSDVR